jgi:hypothetical protein
MAKETEQGRAFKLEVPIDASGVADFKPDMEVRVMLVDRGGKTYSKVTKLDAKGSDSRILSFPAIPASFVSCSGRKAHRMRNC